MSPGKRSGFGISYPSRKQQNKRRKKAGRKAQSRHESKEHKERDDLVDRLRAQGVKVPRHGKTRSERRKEAERLAEAILARSRKKKGRNPASKKPGNNRAMAAAFNAMAGRIGGTGGSDRGARNQ